MASILNKEKILEQARLFIEEGKYDKAIREYEKILIADPSDMRVKLRVAELYAKRKQITDAIRVYREVAAAYTKEGFYLKAVTVYKNVLKLNPSLIEINARLAELYEKMGLREDAARQYNLYAAALEHKGEINKVIDIRKKIVDLMPHDGRARVRLAELYQREGMSEEAVDQYEEYARRLKEEGKDEATLIEMYEKVLSYRSGREDMLRALVRIYYGKGEKKKALRWLEYAKTLTLVDTELLGMQAEIYASLNQAETARTKYMTLSDLYREKGDMDGALDALVRIVVLIPSEQERMERRAAELGPGAREKLKAAVGRFQHEEEERIRREEEEEARAEEVTVKAEKPPEVKAEEKEEERWERAAIIPVKKREEKKPKEPTKKEKMRQAKAAYDLGKYYKEIGLNGESKKELTKAFELYSEFEQESTEAAIRISEIRLLIGVKKSAPKKPKTKAPATKKK